MTQKIPSLGVEFVLPCSKCADGYQWMIFMVRLALDIHFLENPSKWTDSGPVALSKAANSICSSVSFSYNVEIILLKCGLFGLLFSIIWWVVKFIWASVIL